MTALGADDRWRRFHPLSTLMRGGLVLFGVLAWVVGTLTDDVVGSASAGEWDLVRGHLGPAVGALALVLLGAIGVGSIGWLTSAYRVGSAELELRTGILTRTVRRVPYDRVQSVDLVRPVLARLIGLVELRVESAGGADSHVSLAYLSRRDADALRAEILGRAGDEAPPSAPGRPAAGPEGDVLERDVLNRAPAARVLASELLDPWSLLVVAGGALALGSAAAGRPEALPALVPLVVGVGPAKVRAFLHRCGFSARRGPGWVRTSSGLTDTRTATVPLHRVQAVGVVQHALWRPAGWWRVEANVAGTVARDDEGIAASMLAPVASGAEARRTIAAVLDAETAGAVDGLLAGVAARTVATPRRARWLAPITWRTRGAVLTRSAVVVRTGRWRRTVAVVPYARIQSLAVTDGPVGRRLRLATVQVATTSGPVACRIPDIDTGDAARLERALSTRAADARDAMRLRRGRRRGELDPMTAHTEGTGAVPAEETNAITDRLGFRLGQVVQEYGWDDDVDEGLREQIEDVVGEPLEDEDYTGAVDAAILWWRDGDGDLTDALVDVLGTLDEAGAVTLLTPRSGTDGEVDPSEIEDAAKTSGLRVSSTIKAGAEWTATRLVAPKR